MSAPLSALRRIARSRPTPTDERCDMCATATDAVHQHVVDLQSRALMCACRPCHLLFTSEHATLHYRAVPDRYRSLPGSVLDRQAWDDLQIPVGLAFLFHNSVQDRVVAFFPGPAGATESELPLAAWDRIVERAPDLATLRPDVEAVLVRRPARTSATSPAAFLVPIDVCYELTGRLRTVWRGFDGGSAAHAAIDEFFDRVRARSE